MKSILDEIEILNTKLAVARLNGIDKIKSMDIKLNNGDELHCNDWHNDEVFVEVSKILFNANIGELEKEKNQQLKLLLDETVKFQNAMK